MLLAAATTAQAGFINGSISFSGTAELDQALPSATAFSAFPTTTVVSGTGDYSGLVGLAATFVPFTYNPPPISNPILWTVTDASSKVYSFTLTGITISQQGSLFLNLAGTGMAHIDTYSDTPGTWTITDTSGGGREITFGASTTVPDGGMTLLMLGAALSGLGLLKRKLT